MPVLPHRLRKTARAPVASYRVVVLKGIDAGTQLRRQADFNRLRVAERPRARLQYKRLKVQLQGFARSRGVKLRGEVARGSHVVQHALQL